MKKVFIRLFVLSVISIILTGGLCVASIATYDTKSRTENLLDEIQESGEIEDVEGYAYIVEGTGAVLADLGEAIAQIIFLVVIPGIILFVLLVVQIISVIMQFGKQKGWKDLTAKISIYISMGLYLLLCLDLGFVVLSNLFVNKTSLSIALVLNMVCIIVFILQIRRTHCTNT